MKFKKRRSAPKVPDSPVELFNDLRPRRIEALYDQQAQILRNYVENKDKPDVAIQAATGSGKTLVGLLIAEWRRRQGDRPVYLCPTRQLVHQVSLFAQQQLGLDAYAFTGRARDYPQAEKTKWARNQSIAIAPYSALFNIRPFFSDPNFIVVDDAHAADQYIAEYWTVRVARREHPDLFAAIAARLHHALPADEAARLTDEERGLSERLWVQLVPAPIVWELEDELSAVLDQAPERSDLDFRWRVLRGQLKACQLYVSALEIVIRPVLPPTSQHIPFSGATQRLYMSATLGQGGELERLSGRPSVERLPAPSGWDGHGVGRRFFVFPKASLEDDDAEQLTWSLTAQAGKGLFLVPDDRTAKAYTEMVGAQLPEFSIFSARDIEESKSPFVEADKGVAIIANRYDGIDFPQDECRFLVVDGAPTGANLQERFLSDKLGATVLFAERVRTRLVQAFGRCTRSATDFALIVVADERLMDQLLRKEAKEALDRELQAEIDFGIEQSTDLKQEGFLEYARLFFKQGDEWREAEEEIRSLRDASEQVLSPALSQLESAARHEIRYVESMWAAQYDQALDSADQVLGALSGGSDLKGYSAMWHYLAGCAALLSAQQRGTPAPKAISHFQTSRKIIRVRWLDKLNLSANEEQPENASSPSDLVAAEKVEAQLCEMGLLHDRKFVKRETQLRQWLNQDGAAQFEQAQVDLGMLLGFQSDNSDAKGAADPWWIAGENLCIVFEDHSDGSPDNELKLEKARQAARHPTWVRDNVSGLAGDAEIIPVLITPCDCTGPEVQTMLKDVALWPLDDFRSWIDEVLRVVREIRSKLQGPGDLVWRSEALSALESVHATPSSLREMLLKKVVK